MLSSSLAGIIWYRFGSSVALLVPALASMIVIIYFLLIGRIKTHETVPIPVPDPKSGI
jgi:hypothetical protein